jgi:hypothetical protein
VETKLCWGVSEADIIVVHETVNGVELSTDVVLASSVVEVFDGRVSLVIVTEDLLGLAVLVRLVDVVHGEDGQVAVITRIPQGDTRTGSDVQSIDLGLVQVEVDGDGEEVAVRQTVVLHDAVVVLLVHEAFERGETTAEDQFDITELTVVEEDGGEGLGLGGELCASGSIASDEILEDTACGRERMCQSACLRRGIRTGKGRERVEIRSVAIVVKDHLDGW